MNKPNNTAKLNNNPQEHKSGLNNLTNNNKLAATNVAPSFMNSNNIKDINNKQQNNNSKQNFKFKTTEINDIGKDKPEKTIKIKRQILKLDDKTLFYNENGTKKLYEAFNNLDFKDNNTPNSDVK